MYIAIEGVKGTGKSTLLDSLMLDFAFTGMSVTEFCPTRAMPEFMAWEQLCKDAQIDDVLRSQLYAERAKYHAANTDFTQALVLGDRSLITSFITRWPNQSDALPEYLAAVQQKNQCVPLPDMVLYLDAPVEKIQQRLDQRERHYGKHDETPERLREAQQTYTAFFQQHVELGFQEIPVYYFDAMQSELMLNQQVFEFLKEVLASQHAFE